MNPFNEIKPLRELREDSAFNFFGVLHLQRYLKGHKGYVAGGCFKNIFKKEPVKDVDIFFEIEEDFNEANEVFKKDENYSEIYENENAIGYYDKANEVAVDLVRSEFSKPDEMISRFDFTITKFALYSKETEREVEPQPSNMPKGVRVVSKSQEPRVVYHEDFFTHLTLNRLVIDGDLIEFPLNTLDRILRYAKYGYAPCTGTKAKIVRAINSATLPESDTDLFKGFYVGID